MKKLIIGGLGTGKTTLIVNEIIPTLENNYKVVDFCDEYALLGVNAHRIINHLRRTGGQELKEAAIKVIRETNNSDAVLIIDNADVLYFPKVNIDRGFEWLEKELTGTKCVLVFQSIKRIVEGGISANIKKERHMPSS